MSIFKKLFNSSKSAKELELEEFYYQKYKMMGLSKTDIKNTISDCKRKAKKEGDINISDDFGTELLLKAEQGDTACIRAVQNRINGGASKEDIKSWWRLNYLERRMIKWEDDLMRLTTFKSLKDDKGLSTEQAVIELRKAFPIYGDSTDEKNASGEDRPLPDELHSRINKLTQELQPELLKKESLKYSSMNAYFRNKLKN